MARPDGRTPEQLRPVTLTRNWSMHPEGSVLVEFGATRVQPLEGIAEHVVFSLPKGLAHKRGVAKAPGAP